MKSHPGILHRNRIVGLIRQLFRDSAAAWHTFWFEPADPLMLGIMRVLTGWLLFYNLLVWSLDLDAFFRDEGLQPLSAIRQLYESRLVFSFWLWIGDSYLWPVHFACLAIAAMFCMGLATRVTSVLSFLITISYSQRVPIANFGFDQILGMLCLYLCIGPSGSAVSIDALLRRWSLRRRGRSTVVKKVASARMAMRLIQLHLCAIYFWSGLAKLKGPSWWTGEAMWRVLASQEYQTIDLTWMAWIPWLPFLIAHITILWEVFFIVLIWNHRLRPFVLAIGVGMHVGIGAFLGMWTFGLIMTFAYLAFSDPDVWRRRLQLATQWFRKRSKYQGLHSFGEPFAARTRALISEESPDENSHSSVTIREPVFPATSENLRSAEPYAVCIIAVRSSERSALRRYFREHQVACRAACDFQSGLVLLMRDAYCSILINGTGFPTAELIDFVADAGDLAAAPILVMLTAQQLAAVPEIEKITGARWIQLPVSLKQIRQHLQSIQFPPGASFLPDVSDVNPESPL